MLPSIKEQLKLFFVNPIFLSCLFSWLGAQLLKTIINLIYGRIHSFASLMENLIWRTGGMPSSHSALVSAMCTTVGFSSGFNSDVFFIALVFFFVTIRDAVGVRRSAGMQAQKINRIGKELKEKGLLDDYQPLKEINGHTPLQVVMGCVLGFLIGLSFSLLK